MIEGILSATGVALLVAGCVLATIGVLGLILKPDLFEQLHVAGLVTGPGVILVLLASVGTGRAAIVTSAIVMIAFVLVTSSISTHVIAQAGVRRYGALPGDRSLRREVRPVSTVPAAPVDGGPALVAGTRLLEHGMRVVVANDGSPAARVASDLAVAIEWPAGTVVRLLAVRDNAPPEMDPWRADRPDGGRSGSSLQVETELDVAGQALHRRGMQVESSVLRGDPADVIVQETAAFEADVLLTGSRRRGLVSSLFGLSAAGEIVDRAPCPVLVARTSAIREVMLTTDGSTQSAAAAELVARWPIFDLARIRVVTVSADASHAAAAHDGPVRAATADQLIVDATAARLMDAGREVVTEVLHGNPAEQIVETAARRSIDLIIVGSRGRTGLGRTLLGSVAGEVLASASCSVLIVGPRMRRPFFD